MTFVVKLNKERQEPRTLGPLDLSIASRSEGTTVQLCGDSSVAGQRINGHCSTGEVQNNTAVVSEEPCIRGHPEKIDDYVKHIFREHFQEAYRLATGN